MPRSFSGGHFSSRASGLWLWSSGSCSRGYSRNSACGPPVNPLAMAPRQFSEQRVIDEAPEIPAASTSVAQEDAQTAEINFDLAQVEIASVPATRELPARRWLWWGPTVLLVGIVLLFGVAAAVHRKRDTVEDLPDFAKGLRCVKPLLTANNATPRAIKRYQNRMRYLAARLRPQTYEPDLIDGLLNWFGAADRKSHRAERMV